MNNAEEQSNELEALSEIYYNEIEVKSDKSPITFAITVRPQASTYDETAYEDEEDEDEDSDEGSTDVGPTELRQQQCPSVKLLFELPPTYPEVKPSIKILDSNNLKEQDLSELLENLSQKAEESLGEVMVFILVSDVVEWLSDKADAETQEIELESDKRREELDAEERRKIEGTPVTVESFLAWKVKFDAELLKAKLEQQKKLAEQNPAASRGLTGREMFEKDRALAESDLNFVEDLEQEQLEALMQNIDELELPDDDYVDPDLSDDDDEDISVEEYTDESDD